MRRTPRSSGPEEEAEPIFVQVRAELNEEGVIDLQSDYSLPEAVGIEAENLGMKMLMTLQMELARLLERFTGTDYVKLAEEEKE